MYIYLLVTTKGGEKFYLFLIPLIFLGEIL